LQGKRVVLFLQEPFAPKGEMEKSVPYNPVISFQKQSFRRDVTGQLNWVNDQKQAELMIGATNAFFFIHGKIIG
jgi:hypothetical protein